MKVQAVSYKTVKETLLKNKETKALYIQEKRILILTVTPSQNPPCKGFP